MTQVFISTQARTDQVTPSEAVKALNSREWAERVAAVETIKTSFCVTQPAVLFNFRHLGLGDGLVGASMEF